MQKTTTAEPSNVLAFPSIQSSQTPRIATAKRADRPVRFLAGMPSRGLDVDTAIWFNNQRQASGYFRTWR